MQKINNLIKEEDTVTLINGKDGKIKALYGFKKLGGTRTCPNMKLICLFGSGARANEIMVDTNQIAKSKEITLPTTNILWECSTINELQNVENQITPSTALTPSATLCRSNQRNANGTGGEEVKNATPVPIATLTYSKMMCFVPPRPL